MIKLFGAGSSGDGCHVPEADLLCYGDGELRRKRAAKIRDHLKACWTCRAKMERIQKTIADFVDCLNGTLAQEMGRPPRGWQTFRAKLNRVVAQTGKSSQFSPGLGSLRELLPSSPMFIALAAGVLLAS